MAAFNTAVRLPVRLPVSAGMKDGFRLGYGWWAPGAYAANDNADAVAKQPAAIANFNKGQFALTQHSAADITTINYIRNNSMQGASPGVPPTFALFGNAVGISVTVIGVVSKQGMDGLEMELTGTASGTAAFRIQFENNSGIAASLGQSWVHSAFFEYLSGSIGTGSISVEIREYVSGSPSGGNSNSLVASSVVAMPSSPTRFSHTRVTTDATITNIAPTYRIGVTSGETYNYRFRIYWPQMEIGSVATSPVRTTNAAKQRDLTAAMSSVIFGDFFTFTRAGTASFIDANGLLQIAPINAPRWDYTNGKRQLLLEGASTNVVPNAEFAGGVAGRLNHDGVGNTGTWPTNMPSFSFTGMTGYIDISFRTDAQGRRRMRIVANITNISGGSVFPRFRFANDIAAVSGELWSASALFSVASTDQVISAMTEGSTPTATIQSTALGVGEAVIRHNGGAFPAAGQTIIRWQCGVNLGVGATWAGDFEFAMPQLEKSNRCTSYIPTTGTAVTRAADSCIFGAKAYALMLRQSVGFVIRAQALQKADATGGFIVGCSGVSQRLMGIDLSGTAFQLGNSATATIATGMPIPMPAFGAAVTWDTTIKRGSYNGGGIASNASTMDATLSSGSIYLGRNGTGNRCANGWYDEIVIYPFRPTDASLIAQAKAA